VWIDIAVLQQLPADILTELTAAPLFFYSFLAAYSNSQIKSVPLHFCNCYKLKGGTT